MAAFQFCLQSGKQKRAGWVGDDSQVVLGQNFLAKKGEVWEVPSRDAAAIYFVAKVLG
jgi:hypothetical protein